MHVKRQTTRRQRGVRGQIAVLSLVTLPALVGAMGLSVDMGRLYLAKRRLQIAADAAAMEAAREHQRNNDAVVAATAVASAARNAVEAALGQNVAVHHPPETGSRAGDTDFVEVVVTQDLSLRFMRYLTVAPVSLTARAVAGIVSRTPACVCVMDPQQNQALDLRANAQLTATGPGCEVVVASDRARALNVANTACVTGMETVTVRGDYRGTCIDPLPETGSAPSCDPNLSPPAVPGGCDQNNLLVSSGLRVLSPGVYCGGIRVTGGSVTFTPGLYILRGRGLVVSGGALSGVGVTFYSTHNNNAFGRLVVDAGTILLSAPVTGPFANVLFFQDPAAPSTATNQITGNGGQVYTFTGTLYFPSQRLRIANAEVHTQAVAAGRVLLDDNARLRLLPSATSEPGPALALVE
jgi:hypothetical protein